MLVLQNIDDITLAQTKPVVVALALGVDMKHAFHKRHDFAYFVLHLGWTLQTFIFH